MRIVKRTDIPTVDRPEDLPKIRGGPEAGASTSSGTIIPFEILGESINPFDASAPYVLQGTFVQISNLSNALAVINLRFKPTTPFPKTAGTTVEFVADYVDQSMNVANITSLVANTNSIPLLPIPAGGTVIVGIQYVFTPPSSSDATATAVTEANGNRGAIYLTVPVATGSGNLLVTATIRQAFATAPPSPTVLSASAYAVAISAGPIVPFQFGN